MFRDLTMKDSRILTLSILTFLSFGLSRPVLAQPVDGAPSETTTVLERILVKVNGEIITQTDLQTRQIAAIRSRGLQPSTNIELVSMLNDVTPEVIANAVDELLLVQRGKELGYQLNDDQFAEVFENLRNDNGFETDEEFLEAIEEQEDMTPAEFRRIMERQMIVSQVQQVEILNKVAITSVEANDYYETNIEEFTAPATATLREILIQVPQTTDGSNFIANQQAEAEATRAIQRLAEGEEFSAVANEVSDSPTKANGGLIGPFQLSDFSDDIQELVRKLEVGDVSDPIRVNQGYQILKLEVRTDEVATPFDEVREVIMNNFFNTRREEEYQKYLQSLRDEAIVQFQNDELQQAYDDYRINPPIPIQTP